MNFFRRIFSNLLDAVQDALGQSGDVFFDANETWDGNQVAPTTADGFQREPPRKRHNRNNTKADIVAQRLRSSTRHTAKIIKPGLRGLSTATFIEHHDQAVAQAALECNTPINASRLILWVDASLKSGRHSCCTGHAVVFKRAGSWVRISGRRMALGQTSMTAELCAIVLALEFAVQSVKNEETTNKPKVVKIFTDSQSSLRQIAMSSKLSHRNRRKQEGMEDLLQAIVQAAESLETDRVQLEFHWVPRGRVVGNILADKAARLARTAHRLTSNDWVQLDWDLVAEGSSLKLDSDTTNDRTVFGMRRQILASKMVMANQVVLYLPSKTRPGFELSKDMSGSREENDGQRPKTD